MREILPGVLTWPWFSERHGYDFNGYLLRLPGGNLCVDPVEMPREVLEEIRALGVQRIVLTNRNHFRASMKVKERTGAPIAIHPTALKRRWRKAKIAGNLSSVLERSVEHLSCQHGGKIVADAPKLAQGPNRPADQN